jgi:hypothetical protein
MPGQLARGLALAGWLAAGITPALAVDESALTERLARQPPAAVYRWLQRQPVPASPVQAARHYQWLGQLALREHNTAAAIAHFEAAVLAWPYALGARLELSLAYESQGNAQAARASLRGLDAYRGSTTLPKKAARTLQALQQRLGAPAGQTLAVPASGPRQAVQGSLAVSHGFDSNPNLGSRHRTIALNLFDQIADEAVLADESRARPSQFSRVAFSARLPASVLLNRPYTKDWHLQGGAGAQRYHDLDTLHRRDVYLSAEWRPQRSPSRLAATWQHQSVAGMGQAEYLDVEYRRLWGKRWMTEAGLQWQDEPTGRHSYRASAGLWRAWQGALIWGSVDWQARPERAAGDTWRLRLGLQGPEWRFQALRAQVYLQAERRRDTDVYNYVFFGDKKRQETTARLGLRGRLPISQSLDMLVDTQWEQTRANLDLFENRRWSLEATLRWRW